MCGAYGFSVKDAREVYDRFGVVNKLTDFKPRWKIPIGTMNPVVYMTADGAQITYMYWTFLPSWAQEKRLQYSTFNAKDDRLMESMYKEAVPNQRCIIPVTYFFEPDRIHHPKPEPAPWYLFKLKDKEIFGLAGLYNVWTDPNTGKELYTYTIITTKPNADVGKYHDREPAILQNRNEEKQWINPDLTEPEHIVPMLRPYPSGKMEYWRVPDAAKNPRNDYPDVIKPVTGVS
jgi:putative SOS response-associated peptidase YedK